MKYTWLQFIVPSVYFNKVDFKKHLTACLAHSKCSTNDGLNESNHQPSLLRWAAAFPWAVVAHRNSPRSSVLGKLPFWVGSELWRRLLSAGSSYGLIFILATLWLGFRLPRPGHTLAWAESGNQLAPDTSASPGHLSGPKVGNACGSNHRIIDSDFTWVSVRCRGLLWDFIH